MPLATQLFANQSRSPARSASDRPLARHAPVALARHAPIALLIALLAGCSRGDVERAPTKDDAAQSFARAMAAQKRHYARFRTHYPEIEQALDGPRLHRPKRAVSLLDHKMLPLLDGLVAAQQRTIASGKRYLQLLPADDPTHPQLTANVASFGRQLGALRRLRATYRAEAKLYRAGVPELSKLRALFHKRAAAGRAMRQR